MPDLRPDTSIYSHVGQPSGIGAMSLGDLLSLAQRSGEYSTARTMSDVLTRNRGPDGLTNFEGAAGDFGASNAPLKTPAQFQSLTQAAEAQSALHATYTSRAIDALSSAVNQGNKISKHRDVIPLVTSLSKAGLFPTGMLTDAIANLPESGPGLISGLVNLRNFLTGGKPAETAQVYNPETRQMETVPAGQANLKLYGGAPAGGGAPGAPAAPGGRAPAGGALGPGFSPGIPGPGPGAPEAGKTAADMSVKLRGAGQNLADQEALLLNMGDLSAQAASGPTAEPEKALGELWFRVFPNSKGVTMTKDDLASTESYAKFAERLAGMMPSAASGLNVGWQNAYGSNPNLHLSVLGRNGITNWLLGNNDAQKLVMNKWNEWITANPGKENQFYDWLNRPAGQGGFGIQQFDPRVFQYERLSPLPGKDDKTGKPLPSEQERFVGMMKRPGEVKRFHANLKEYEKRGWVDEAQ